MRARILGTGSYLPSRVLTNADIEGFVDTDDAWIRDRTGIAARHIAADEEVTSDLATAAATQALEASGLGPADIDLLVVGTVTADTPLPSCAVHVAHKLGLGPVPAFDVAAACSGFVYGLSTAEKFVRTGESKAALVVGVELLSRVVDWEDRTTAVLFGDGAGAVVLGPTEDPTRGVIATRLGTDASLRDALAIPAGGSAIPAAFARSPDLLKIKMRGQEIFRAAIEHMADVARDLLAGEGVTTDDVAAFIPHQANLRIVTACAQRLGVPLERFVLHLGEVGNTSSASIPIALDRAIRAGRLRAGDLVCAMALGAGITWGGALIRLG